MADSRWITLDGAVNVRDLGGLPTVDGEVTVANRLIRSDNLQQLSPADLRYLVDACQVRSVADLRTWVEVDAEGPGPMVAEADVHVGHFSLFPEAGRNTDAAAVEQAEADGAETAGMGTGAFGARGAGTPIGARRKKPVVLPWQGRVRDLGPNRKRGAAAVYLGYLDERADTAVAALRFIAQSDGAVIVHCAAGKDRTGVVIALALAEVGVPRDEIVADYALSGERIQAIFARLAASATYADDLQNQSVDQHRSRAATMENLLGTLDERDGGVGSWLRAHGWTHADADALRGHLLG